MSDVDTSREGAATSKHSATLSSSRHTLLSENQLTDYKEGINITMEYSNQEDQGERQEIPLETAGRAADGDASTLKEPSLSEANVPFLTNLPDDIFSNILSFSDDSFRVCTVVMQVSRAGRDQAKRAIDFMKKQDGGAFKSNHELRHAVQKYSLAKQSNNTHGMKCIAVQYGYPINKWNVSKVKDFSWVFYGMCSRLDTFNEAIGDWDVSQATTMSFMFHKASSFNQNLSKWDTSNVRDMSSMFYGASRFNGNVSNFDTTKVINMDSMFAGATCFSGDVSKWDTSNVKDMRYMFQHARCFTGGDLSHWNVANVTNLRRMFDGASCFTGNVSTWDTQNVTDMSYMFCGAVSFQSDLSMWDTSNVTDMEGMFLGATAFRVANMRGLLHRTWTFDKDHLDHWTRKWNLNPDNNFRGVFVCPH
jgi:surface protein